MSLLLSSSSNFSFVLFLFFFFAYFISFISSLPLFYLSSFFSSLVNNTYTNTTTYASNALKPIPVIDNTFKSIHIRSFLPLHPPLIVGNPTNPRKTIHRIIGTPPLLPTPTPTTPTNPIQKTTSLLTPFKETIIEMECHQDKDKCLTNSAIILDHYLSPL